MVRLPIFLIFLLLPFSALLAQESWPDTSKHEGLKWVENKARLHVFISEKAQVDSLSLHYLKEARTYFDSIFGMYFPVAVLYVSNDEWNQYAYYPPPGMPQAWAGNIFLGSEKSIVAQQAEQQLNNLPKAQLTELQTHFGTPLNMDLFYRHNVAIHELGHLYHFYEARESQRKWLQEVFATYATHAYLLKFQPDLAAASQAYADIGSQALFPQIKHTSLEAFERLYLSGLGPQNYEWFQFQLFEKALQLYDQFGIEGLLKLRGFLVATDLEHHPALNNDDLRQQALQHLGEAMTDLLFEWNY